MLGKIILFVLLAPILEIALLIRLGGWLGFWPTVGLLIGAGAAGAALARSQGTRLLRDIRYDLAGGRVPPDRVLDGLLILIGGFFLLLPGLISDAIAILLLLKPVRTRVKAALRRRFTTMVRPGEVGVITFQR
jgi:UPF0716 protein FxsA